MLGRDPVSRSIVEPPGALPGSTHLDPGLVDGVVNKLNAIHEARSQELYRQIGTTLLAEFFRNSSAAFERRGREHVSFRALAAREDLALSATTLFHAVAIEVQHRQFPPELAERLSITHHRILLPIADRALKERLARETVREALGTRALQERVRLATRSPGERRGRPPLPQAVKEVRRLSRTIEALVNDPSVQADQQLAEALGELDDHLRRLLAWRAGLASCARN